MSNNKEDLTFCSSECEEYYPYYGCAPHTSFDIQDGKIITNKIRHKQHSFKKWKKENFLPDEEYFNVEKPDLGMTGVFYCPKCANGFKNKKRIKNFYRKIPS